MTRIPVPARVLPGLFAAALASPLLAQQPATPPAPASPAAALGLYVYPAKGQDAAQQAKDETECRDWSKAQASNAPAPATTAQAEPAKQVPGGERIKGAVRGAAAGAVIGEVANDDASEGAKVGAAAGTLAGGHRTRKARRDQKEEAQEQAAEQAKAAEQAQADAVKRGMAACLEGRGYTVK
jgi:hypothetical protein